MAEDRSLILCTVVLIGLVLISPGFSSATPAALGDSAVLLEQARAEKDLAARVEMLNQMLKDPKLKGAALAAIFLER